MSLRSITNQLNVMQSRRMNPENIAMETMQLRSTAYELARNLVPIEDRMNLFEKKIGELSGKAKKEPASATRIFKDATQKSISKANKQIDALFDLSNRNRKVISSVQDEVGLFRTQRKKDESTSTKLKTENRTLKREMTELGKRLKKLEKPPRKAPPRPQAKKYKFRSDMTPVLSPDDERSPFYYNLLGGKKDTGNIAGFLATFGLASLGAAGLSDWLDKNKDKLGTLPEDIKNALLSYAESVGVDVDKVVGGEDGRKPTETQTTKPKPLPASTATPVSSRDPATLIGAARAGYYQGKRQAQISSGERKVDKITGKETATQPKPKAEKPRGATVRPTPATAERVVSTGKKTAEAIKNTKTFAAFAKAMKLAAKTPLASAIVGYSLTQLYNLRTLKEKNQISAEDYKKQSMKYYTEIASTVGGATIGGIIGGVGGTFVAPGIGTIGLGIAGAIGGAAVSYFAADSMGEILYNIFEKADPPKVETKGEGKKVSETGNAKQAMDFFISKGYTKEQAAGIVGNLIQESGLKTDAFNPKEGTYGIAQWKKDRQDLFKKTYGKSIEEATFKEQLQFIDWELNNTEQAAKVRILEARTARDAAVIVDKTYERSAGRETEQRVQYAEEILRSQPTAKIETPKTYDTVARNNAPKVAEMTTRSVAVTPTDGPVSVATPPPPETDTAIAKIKEDMDAQAAELLAKVKSTEAMAAASYTGASQIGSNLQKTARNVKEITTAFLNSQESDFYVVNNKMLPSIRNVV